MSRIRSCWERATVKHEIIEELRFHIQARTKENLAAGMSPEDAAREARKRFGHVQSVREDCRDARGASLGEAAWNDIRFGLRMLRRNPYPIFLALREQCAAQAGISAYSTLYEVKGHIYRMTT